MKNVFLFCLLALFSWGACKNDNSRGEQDIRGGNTADLVRNPATAGQSTDTTQLARITYDESTFDFGEAVEGEVVVHKFKFTNTGKVPLTILKARSSCGCTIPEYPEEPVPPGAGGEITARFNTEGKHDLQKKLIYITANTYPGESSVMLKGIVKAKE
ncbi:MAG: DUF1573 domain-containing protein [Lewinellaceae bacterium]|nr:DUF1573 domain-containing protein [Lewinellaceae bacterium]